MKMVLCEKYKLRSWVNEDYLITRTLSNNPRAIHILEKNINANTNKKDKFNTLENKIDWYNLSGNVNAISILEKNIDKINWEQLSVNINAIHLLEKNVEKIDWFWLSSNINAVPLLEKNIDKIHWGELSRNKNAYHLLKQNPDKIHWNELLYYEKSKHANSSSKKNKFILCDFHPNAIPLLETLLCDNPIHTDIDKNLKIINNHWYLLSKTPSAIRLLETYPDKINWTGLSSNPNAIHLLEQNPEKINWRFLSNNPNAIHLIEQNLEKIDWTELSKNPKAIHLLEKNMDKIRWRQLLYNKNAIHLLEQNPSKIKWKCVNNSKYLSRNPNLIHLFVKYPNKLNEFLWYHLLENPDAYSLIKSKIFNARPQILKLLSRNPNYNILNLLEYFDPTVLGFSGWYDLSENPEIFELDYQEMSKQRTHIILEKLMKTVLHPSRIQHIMDTYYLDFDEVMEMYI
jgi:hypothetical protein